MRDIDIEKNFKLPGRIFFVIIFWRFHVRLRCFYSGRDVKYSQSNLLSHVPRIGKWLCPYEPHLLIESLFDIWPTIIFIKWWCLFAETIFINQIHGINITLRVKTYSAHLLKDSFLYFKTWGISWRVNFYSDNLEYG